MRFTMCGCDVGHYQRLPRKWWMRLFPTRHRYRCRSCGARMLVPDGTPARVHWFLMIVVCGVVLAVVVWAVGYWEAASEAAWKRSVSG